MDSLQPGAVITASLAASTAAIRHWAESGGKEDLTELLGHAFDALRAEFAAQSSA